MDAFAAQQANAVVAADGGMVDVVLARCAVCGEGHEVRAAFPWGQVATPHCGVVRVGAGTRGFPSRAAYDEWCDDSNRR